jgi:hypothetical protein
MPCKIMKVIREKSREYKGKSYFKYKVNLPEKVLKEAKIECGDDLIIEFDEGRITLKKK